MKLDHISPRKVIETLFIIYSLFTKLQQPQSEGATCTLSYSTLDMLGYARNIQLFQIIKCISWPLLCISWPVLCNSYIPPWEVVILHIGIATPRWKTTPQGRIFNLSPRQHKRDIGNIPRCCLHNRLYLLHIKLFPGQVETLKYWCPMCQCLGLTSL